MKSQSRLIAEYLAGLAEEGADSAQVADAVVATWRDIEAAMSPIIGRRSVAVLYLRSVHLSNPDYPLLAGARDSAYADMDLDGLKAVLLQQTPAGAAHSGGMLLQMFYELLTSLVGLSLTEQLLRPVWARLPSGSPAQDHTP